MIPHNHHHHATIVNSINHSSLQIIKKINVWLATSATRLVLHSLTHRLVNCDFGGFEKLCQEVSDKKKILNFDVHCWLLTIILTGRQKWRRRITTAVRWAQVVVRVTRETSLIAAAALVQFSFLIVRSYFWNSINKFIQFFSLSLALPRRVHCA